MAERQVLLKVQEDLKTYFFTYDGIAKAVDGVNFEIAVGETLGLVGETGCGKSLTALSILRLVDPPGRIVSGKIMFEGENLLEKTSKEMEHIRGNNIGMIFQDPMSSLNPVMTVGFQLKESIKLHMGVRGEKAGRLAIEMLEQVRIPEPSRIMKCFPHELSGGMQQRVMIGIALCCHPKLIIADEPTTALDVTIQAQILRLIRDLKRDFKSSMLMITHNLGLVSKNCDRVGVMYAGNLVEVCDVSSVFSKPLHPYTKGLIEAIPKVNEEQEMLSVIPGRIPDILNPPTGCKFHSRCMEVSPECSEEKPQLLQVKQGHWVACSKIRDGY
jgi:oligopeptide/dipeptide ABC transporter ATP-binding protein